jgi:hypothetical protein
MTGGGVLEAVIPGGRVSVTVIGPAVAAAPTFVMIVEYWGRAKALDAPDAAEPGTKTVGKERVESRQCGALAALAAAGETARASNASRPTICRSDFR